MNTFNQNDKIIEVRHLSASFGNRKILSDISFTAYTGQITVILGGSGSGKTTIGKHLAKMLKLNFHDCDQEIEHATGASVNLIFDVEGEEGFRLRENQMLRQLTTKTGILIATGGGVVCNEENHRLLA